MKSLLSVLLLAGALGLAAGCGPQEAFCPNVGADAGGVCPIFGDDAVAPVQDMQHRRLPDGLSTSRRNPDGQPDVCVANP